MSDEKKVTAAALDRVDTKVNALFISVIGLLLTIAAQVIDRQHQLSTAMVKTEVNEKRIRALAVEVKENERLRESMRARGPEALEEAVERHERRKHK